MSNFNEIKINTYLNEIDSSFIDQMFLEIDIPSFSFPRSVFRFFLQKHYKIQNFGQFLPEITALYKNPGLTLLIQQFKNQIKPRNFSKRVNISRNVDF